MTTLITQLSYNDCVLAAIAMAVGKEKWHDAWTDADLAEVKESHGVGELGPWMERQGLKEYDDYRSLYVHRDDDQIKVMLWNRRALLSVNSLNHEGGSHMIYWDGKRIWDPNEGFEGKMAFRVLSSVRITRAYIFKD